MTLSVIIPTYNHANLLPTCLEAIFSQSHLPDEVIAIDDCSTDHTQRILLKFQHRFPQLKMVSNERNLGPAVSMNQVLQHAKGQYLAFCASDDYVLPGFFKAAIELLEQNPKVGICSGNHLEIRKETTREIKTLNYNTEMVFDAEGFRALLKKTHLVIPSHASIYRKSCVLETELFIPELYHLCDWFLNITCALKHGFAYIPSKFAAMRILAGAYSKSSIQDPHLRREIINTVFHKLSKNKDLKCDFKECHLFSHFHYPFFKDFLKMPIHWKDTLPSFPHKLKRTFLKRSFGTKRGKL